MEALLACNGGLAFVKPGIPQACPDPEATGNCVSNGDPGVWYYFEQVVFMKGKR